MDHDIPPRPPRVRRSTNKPLDETGGHLVDARSPKRRQNVEHKAGRETGWMPRLVGSWDGIKPRRPANNDGCRRVEPAPPERLDQAVRRLLDELLIRLMAEEKPRIRLVRHIHEHHHYYHGLPDGRNENDAVFPQMTSHLRSPDRTLLHMTPGESVSPQRWTAGSQSGTDAIPFPHTLTRSPIADAVDAACADMRRRGSVESSINRFRRLWLDCIAFNGWDEPRQCSYQGASVWLAHKRETGWSGPTHDQGVSALRVFGRFLHRAGYVQQNPFEFVETSGESGGSGSRALTTDEVRAMIRTALERQQKDGRARGNRALFWAFLALTGLRTAEAEACRWRDIDLDGNPPAIYSDPKWAKNGRRMRVVLNDEIVGLLREHRKTVPCRPDDLVFPVVPNRASWRTIRELAGIKPEDSMGREATTHGLRKWLATTLDATGASPGVVSRILRHSDTLAQERYIDPDPSSEVAAVQRLPKIWPESEKKVLTSGSEPTENDNATPSEKSMGSPSASSQASAPAALGGVAIASDPNKARAAGADAWADVGGVQRPAAGAIGSSGFAELGNGYSRPRNDSRSQPDSLTARRAALPRASSTLHIQLAGIDVVGTAADIAAVLRAIAAGGTQ